MLEANKSHWFEKIFAVYNRNLLRRNFSSLNVSGLDLINDPKPHIIYANHSSWWDGLIAFEISNQIQADSFVMMEEKHLQRLFLFRRIGAFSVNRHNGRQAVESLNYAVDLLRKKLNATLWIFPQGEILPNDVRPLKFYNGLARIISKLEFCRITCLAIRYEFLGEYKPQIFIKIGVSETFSSTGKLESKNLTGRLEDNLTNTLNELKNDVNSKNTDIYTKLL